MSQDLIANNQKEYKRLGSIINDGRLAGLIDWDAIEDRTRSLEELPSWESPGDIIASAASSFRLDKWEDQHYRVECWVEKQALAGVFENACRPLQVATFACRGYVSQSEMWAAAQRLRRYEKLGKETVILHFGDHDPSGIDMTRDITDRLKLFGCKADVSRVALNMKQIEEYQPPPNPAKDSDARFAGYREQFGDQSWELDALEPRVLRELIELRVLQCRDEERWRVQVARERQQRTLLEDCSDGWNAIVVPALTNAEEE